MNKIHEEKLAQLNLDRLMLEAIYCLIEIRLEKNRPDISEGDSNEILGEKYRAYDTAKGMIKGFFDDIKSFEDKKVNNTNFNKEK